VTAAASAVSAPLPGARGARSRPGDARRPRVRRSILSRRRASCSMRSSL